MRIMRYFSVAVCFFLTFHGSTQVEGEDSRSIDDLNQKEIDKLLEELLNENRLLDRKINCLRQLDVVADWLRKTDTDNAAKLGDLMKWEFERSINITDFNNKQWEDAFTGYQEWSGTVGRKASELMAEYSDPLAECGRYMKRMLEQYWLDSSLVPTDEKEREKLSALLADLEETYSTSEVIKDSKVYRLDPELSSIMGTSRDYEQLLWAWRVWHDVGVKVKANFTEVVNIYNLAAKNQGFPDAAMLWKYSDVEDVAAEDTMKMLMEEISPLYQQIHAFVRNKLFKLYESQLTDAHEDIFTQDGPIPAHILGNMWAQQWINIEDAVLPFPDAPSLPNVTEALVKRNFTVRKMFELAEDFFVSLGFQPMTDIFWNKSVIVRPSDPKIQMVCHASASDMVAKDDYRIKMCTQVSASDLEVIHHEMGHIAYFMEYHNQPTVFRRGANSAFHEAIGDTIAMSVVTAKHLEAIGLVVGTRRNDTTEKVDSKKINELLKKLEDQIKIERRGIADEKYKIEINSLMRRALERFVFLPFGLSLELWRYEVLKGNIKPEDYNTKWWEMRKKYQGIVPPVTRNPSEFDAGAKYHVATFVPYGRYFFSSIAQFQFHESLCEESQNSEPIQNCDFYKSKEAGEKLRSVLREGSSKPWPTLMKMLTGQSRFSARAMMRYFEPLHKWLIEQNVGVKVGW